MASCKALNSFLQGNIALFQQDIKQVEDVNEILEDGDTLLHHAVIGRNAFVTQLIINYKGDLSIRDSFGRYPLHFAVQSGHLPTVQLVIKQTDESHFDVRDKNGWNVFHYAAALDKKDVIQHLLKLDSSKISSITKDKRTLLHIAASNGNVAICQFLISQQCPIDKLDSSGCTCLHYAASNGHSDTITLLINNGVDPNIRSSSRQTALDIANDNNHTKCISILEKAISESVCFI